MEISKGLPFAPLEVTRIVPVRSDVSVFVVHVTVTTPLFVPEAGLIEIQSPDVNAAVQAIVPPPVLLILNVDVPPVAGKDIPVTETVSLEVGFVGVVGVLLQAGTKIEMTRTNTHRNFLIQFPFCK